MISETGIKNTRTYQLTPVRMTAYTKTQPVNVAGLEGAHFLWEFHHFGKQYGGTPPHPKNNKNENQTQPPHHSTPPHIQYKRCQYAQEAFMFVYILCQFWGEGTGGDDMEEC